MEKQVLCITNRPLFVLRSGRRRILRVENVFMQRITVNFIHVSSVRFHVLVAFTTAPPTSSATMLFIPRFHFHQKFVFIIESVAVRRMHVYLKSDTILSWKARKT